MATPIWRTLARRDIGQTYIRGCAYFGVHQCKMGRPIFREIPSIGRLILLNRAIGKLARKTCF